MNRRRRRRALTILVLAMIFAPLSAASDPPAAGQPLLIDPGCPGVELAPEAPTDRNPDGTPVRMSPDQRGKHVPVIVIHGWTGRSTHGVSPAGAFSNRIDLSTDPDHVFSAQRSLIGQIQRLGGTAVFTFDYHDYSARWVTDRHQGPALGSAIDCLYAATGERVIVVAHSMGGLVTRYALTQAPGFQERQEKVSTVVTFGTPQDGSLMAAIIAGGVDLGALLNSQIALVRALLAGCGALSTVSLDTGTLCDWLPGAVRAFDSAAGRALRAGSSELRALAAWPGEVPLDALGGEAVFTVPRNGGWFRLPWQTSDVPLGDLIVDSSSARRGSEVNKLGSCTYQMDVIRGATDQIGLVFGQVARPNVARQPLGSFTGACFHTNLMRTVQLTNEAIGAIAADLESRQGYELPAMCDLPAAVWIADQHPQSNTDTGLGLIERRVEADITGDGEPEFLLQTLCSYGGNLAMRAVYVVSSDGSFLGRLPIEENASSDRHIGAIRVDAVDPDATINVTAAGFAEGDPNCCPSVETFLKFRWHTDHFEVIQVETAQRETARPTWDDQSDRAFFATPSRNIFCWLDDEHADCEIADRSWTPPPRRPSCDLSWGSRLVLDRGGADFLCYGDTLSTAPNVLAYGETVSRGTLSCSVDTEGLTCSTADRSHGFFLSRSRYSIW